MSYDLWGRLRYMLSPQFDIYETICSKVHGSVADIGSGTGFGTHLLARTAKVVDGYEVDRTARDFAQRTFSNGNIQFYQGSITENIVGNFNTNYDFVVMVDVIEHIREDRLAIQNCKRLLKSGGTFMCSTPNRLSRYRKSEYHVKEYSPGDLRRLLSGVFSEVDLMDHQMLPLESEYENPMIGVCQ